MVSLSNNAFNFPLLAKSLAGITAYFKDGSIPVLIESAKDLESLCDRQLVSRKYEPIYLAIAGLSLDAAGEGPRSKKAYTKLKEYSLPAESFLANSNHNAKLYTDMLSYFGLRDFDFLILRANEIIRNIQTVQETNENEFTRDDNYLILMGILDILLTYSDVVKSNAGSKLSELAMSSKDLEETLTNAGCVPWLSILGRLCCKSINSAVRRSILNLDLPNSVVERLAALKRVELWEPQMDAVSKGILKGERLLMCTNTATGKTFLSSLVASKSSPDNKVVYLSPTRSLAEEVASKMKDYLQRTNLNVAISTRERPESDDFLGDCSVVVATYEKFNSLLKRNLLNPSSLKTVIVDEVHKIGEHDRGITLEFIMTRFNKLNGNGPQMLALSGMINDNDLTLFSEWMHADYTKSKWRPINLSEMILCEGQFLMKDGTIKETGFSTSSTGSSSERRIKTTFRLIQSEITNDGQCLVISMSRAKVETMAQELCELVKRSINPDVIDLNQKDEEQREEIIRRIFAVEPALPLYARNLIEMIRFGVAYHHAGLPLKYRSAIEEGVRKKAIRVIVATTTMEAGVNLPVSMVIFPSPRERSGKYSYMTTSAYRNLAGRAGRPEFDSKGSSVLLALTKDEAKLIKESYFDKEDDELRSGMMQFMKNVPETRYAVQTEMLSLIGEDSKTQQEIADEMKHLWFWKKASDKEKNELPGKLSWEIEKLRRFECVEFQNGKIVMNHAGRIVNQSMLYAFSIKNLLDNCRRIMQGRYEGKQFDMLVLSAVGIPNEMRGYDDIMKAVVVNPDTAFVKNIMRQDGYLKEMYDDTKYCAQFATILGYWIDSLNTEKIIEQGGLKQTHAAFIEESLREDAFWILSIISKMPNNILKMTEKQRKRTADLAKFCKYGSSDPTVIALLDLGLVHIGRTTAIKISEFLRRNQKNIAQLEKSEIENLFANNKYCADLLYKELVAGTQPKREE